MFKTWKSEKKTQRETEIKNGHWRRDGFEVLISNPDHIYSVSTKEGWNAFNCKIQDSNSIGE